MFCKIIQELLEAAVQEVRDADQQMSCIYNIQGLGTNSKVFITELLIWFYQGQYQILIIKESDNQYWNCYAFAVQLKTLFSKFRIIQTATQNFIVLRV